MRKLSRNMRISASLQGCLKITAFSRISFSERSYQESSIVQCHLQNVLLSFSDHEALQSEVVNSKDSSRIVLIFCHLPRLHHTSLCHSRFIWARIYSASSPPVLLLTPWCCANISSKLECKLVLSSWINFICIFVHRRWLCSKLNSSLICVCVI